MRKFHLGPDHADVTAIVIAYNSARDIPRLISSLRKASVNHSIRCIVVDNHSTDETLSVLGTFEDIQVIESGGNLGYAGGINVGVRVAGDCDYLLILNPDVVLFPSAVDHLISAVTDRSIGAAVPLIVDQEGNFCPSLHREPSIMQTLCDSVITARLASRIGLPSGTEFRSASYRYAHDIDWAVGAAILIPTRVAGVVGEWDERFFMYAEEVDYFRRIRNRKLRVRFEPKAIVHHRGSGSGSSDELFALLNVNRIRYAEKYHGRLQSIFIQLFVVVGLLLRASRRSSRKALKFTISRRDWQNLPHRKW